MDKKHEVQVEILLRGQSYPALQNSSKQLFSQLPPFMVQISPKYFHSQEPQAHITFKSSQIFKTHLFHVPVKSSIDSRDLVATIQFVRNNWEMTAEGQMQLFNGDKTIVHWTLK